MTVHSACDMYRVMQKPECHNNSVVRVYTTRPLYKGMSGRVNLGAAHDNICGTSFMARSVVRDDA
jgi:hypothetical protein